MILVSRGAELRCRVNEIVSFGSREPSLSPGTTNSFSEIYSPALNVKSKYSAAALAIESFYFDLALSFRQTETIRSVLRRRLTYNRDGTPGISINGLFVISSKSDRGYF